MKSSVELLTAIAPQFKITLALQDGNSSIFVVPVAEPSGRTHVFRIRVINDKNPSATEVSGVLPSFCPQRHINSDGSFCLGWGKDAPAEVTGTNSAEAWWGGVLEFLRLQLRAARARKWTGPEWAHGDAAKHQMVAENAAKQLGNDVFADLQQYRLKVEWSSRTAPNGGRILKVRRRDKEWFAVLERERRVINKQQPCVCAIGSVKHHRRLRNCCDHSQQAYQLAISLMEWRREEERFWMLCSGVQCCKTIDDCPLGKSSEK